MKRTLIGLAAAMLLAPAVLAADGQVLINQSAVNAAGGFPYVISQPGSYKLSGNLILDDINKTAIRIASDSVTLDLGGFAILGSNDCTDPSLCRSGKGNGIDTLGAHYNITIRNGTIQGMGNAAITLTGNSFLIEYLRIYSNPNRGVELRGVGTLAGQTVDAATIQFCTLNIHMNAFATAIFTEGGRVSHNDITEAWTGIEMPNGGTVDHNTIAQVGGGLVLGDFVSYFGNVISSFVQTVSGGHNLGQNLCNTQWPSASAPCP